MQVNFFFHKTFVSYIGRTIRKTKKKQKNKQMKPGQFWEIVSVKKFLTLNF